MPTSMFYLCRFCRFANLPIAGGKGNYWQNAMYMPDREKMSLVYILWQFLARLGKIQAMQRHIMNLPWYGWWKYLHTMQHHFLPLVHYRYHRRYKQPFDCSYLHFVWLLLRSLQNIVYHFGLSQFHGNVQILQDRNQLRKKIKIVW